MGLRCGTVWEGKGLKGGRSRSMAAISVCLLSATLSCRHEFCHLPSSTPCTCATRFTPGIQADVKASARLPKPVTNARARNNHSATDTNGPREWARLRRQLPPAHLWNIGRPRGRCFSDQGWVLSLLLPSLAFWGDSARSRSSKIFPRHASCDRSPRFFCLAHGLAEPQLHSS